MERFRNELILNISVMKKLYVLMAGALCAMSVGAAGIEVNFSSENPCWTVGNDAVVSYADGHLSVEMPESNGKWRADLKYVKGETDGYTVNADQEKILAIKFIGARPQGNMTLEMDNDGAWMKNDAGKDAWSNKPQGSVVTTGGNTIYYYDLTRSPQFTGTVVVTKMNFKIADNTEAPHSYVVDWVKTYADVAALEADKDWADDSNDQDEANAAPSPVNNETTGAGFSTLTDALAAAADGDVLVVNENQTVTGRIGLNNRHITIKGGDDEVKIMRGERFNNSLMFLVNRDEENTDADGNKLTGRLTFEDITIDGQGVESSQACIEASKGGTCDFRNVKFVNCVSTHNQGLVSMKDGGRVNVENVVTEGCTVPAGRGEFFCGTNTNNLIVSGDNLMSVFCEKITYFTAGELTGDKVITIYCDADRNLTDGAVIVRGTEEVARFRSGVDGKNLKAEVGNIVWFEDPAYSGVEGVAAEVEGVAPVYYNLQGVKVENPNEGLYIVVRGGKVAKEIVK